MNPTIQQLKQKIEKLEKENQLLKEQAVKDPLTTLFNKRGLQEAQENIIATILRGITEGNNKKERNIRTIFFDLNELKELNDTKGHTIGDNLIKEMAQYIKDIVGRTGDIAARWGGDEFIVLLKNDNRQSKDYLDIQKKKYPNLKFSAGVVDLNLNNLYEEIVSETGRENHSVIKEKMLTELINKKILADAIMYEAKKLNKRNANFIFEEELTPKQRANVLKMSKSEQQITSASQ